MLRTRLDWRPEKRIERPSCWAEVTVESQLIWPHCQISNLAWWPKALPSEQAAGGHAYSVDMPCFACNRAARMENHAQKCNKVSFQNNRLTINAIRTNKYNMILRLQRSLWVFQPHQQCWKLYGLKIHTTVDQRCDFQHSMAKMMSLRVGKI